jgi:hypothetical protein
VNKLRTLPWVAVAVLICALVLSGCGASNGVSVSLTPSSAKAIDQGQTVNITATVTNDSKSQGVTWTLSGAGSLSNTSSTSVTYDAPANVPAGTTASATVTATSVTDTTKTAQVTIVVAAPPSISTTGSLAAATEGSSYSATITDSGGSTPYGWSISSGSLPPGLTLAASTANSVTVAGTPTTQGSYTFSIKVTDGAGDTTTQALSITVNSPPPPTITTTSLPGATVGTSYSQTLQGSAGVKPYSWAVTGGSLPAGLTLSSSGVISGTPTGPTTGNSTFTVTLTDSELPTPQSVSATFTINVTASPLAVKTTSLSGGTIGTPYSQTLQAIGGITPYNWAITGGSLPAGLTLNSNGTITGTPTGTFTGTSNFQVTVTDAEIPTPQSTVANLSITITTAPLVVSTSSLPQGVVNSSYSATLQASGGIQPYTWAVSGGSLPGGLTLSPTGTISGTPTASGTFSFSVTVTDSETPTAKTTTASLSISVNPALTITTASLPGATIGVSYNQTLVATGGIQPYSWALATGSSLPAGLTLSSAGVISGTPTGPLTGTTTFTVTVTDSESPGKSVSTTLSINVTAQPLTITTTSLPAGVINSPYSGSLQASGGVQPYTWALALGSSLPPGLTLSSNGAISGTPTATGTTTFTVTVTDSQLPTHNSTNATLSITINATQPPSVSTTNSNLPAGIQNSAYPSTTLQASGGVSPYTWTVTGGSLPTGLTLSSSGVISGTPTATGTFNFTVKVTDSEQPPKSATANLSITINGPLAITTTSPLPAGVVNTPYTDTLKANGGTGPYTWAQTGGSLPAGLSLSATGVISGTPTATGTSTFTVQVTDSENPAATVTGNFSLTINSSANCANNAKFNGNFVFLFQGWTSGAVGFDLLNAVGSFTADGAGGINSGMIDTNEAQASGSGYQSATFTGSYCVPSTGIGTMTLTFSAPISGTITYALTVDSSGNAEFIEYDTFTIYGTGTAKKRSTNSFSTSTMTGNYAFGFIGVDSSGARTGAAGSFQANGTGGVSNGEIDIDDNGTVANSTLSGTNLTIASSGRGTVTLTVTGQGSLNFVLYVVSPTEAVAMATDSVAAGNVLISGEILQQSGSLTDASLNGTAVVEHESLSGGNAPAVTAGFAIANGSGNLSINLDQNKGGTMSNTSGSGTYSVAANGRVTLSGFGNNEPVFYLVSQNKGFIMGTNTGVDFGLFEPQSGSSFTNASLSGAYLGGSREPQNSNVNAELDVVSFDGVGSLSGTGDNDNSSFTPQQGTISGTYSVAANGKVTVTHNGSVGVYLYIVSTSKFVVLSINDTNPKLVILQH